jgi:hypothetical protein
MGKDVALVTSPAVTHARYRVVRSEPSATARSGLRAWARSERPVLRSLLAGVVLERDPETDAVVENPTVLDGQILTYDLGHA